MKLLIAIFIICWVIGSFIAEGVFTSNALGIKGDWVFVNNPKVIYRNTKMNIFGCTILWLLLRVASPLASIWLFIYWAFHVGRKFDTPIPKGSF